MNIGTSPNIPVSHLFSAKIFTAAVFGSHHIMSFEIPDRVHIMAVGYEEDRVHQAVEKLRADRIVLIEHSQNDDDGRRHLDNVVDNLIKRGFDPRIEKCDYFNLFDAIATFNKLIDEYRDDEIYVNVSTGSKLTAIAGMIASMINDVTPYYAKAGIYSDHDIPREIEEIFELPRYRIDPPDPDHIKILKYLLENKNSKITKGELIDYCEVKEISHFRDRDISKKGKYRMLDNYIIEPMLTESLIDVEKSGRSRVIRITDNGKNVLEAFGLLIDKSFKDTQSPDELSNKP